MSLEVNSPKTLNKALLEFCERVHAGDVCDKAARLFDKSRAGFLALKLVQIHSYLIEDEDDVGKQEDGHHDDDGVKSSEVIESPNKVQTLDGSSPDNAATVSGKGNRDTASRAKVSGMVEIGNKDRDAASELSGKHDGDVDETSMKKKKKLKKVIRGRAKSSEWNNVNGFDETQESIDRFGMLLHEVFKDRIALHNVLQDQDVYFAGKLYRKC